LRSVLTSCLSTNLCFERAYQPITTMETHAHGCVFVSVDLSTNYNQGNARTWICVCLSRYEP
jgi:hypothetical protein